MEFAVLFVFNDAPVGTSGFVVEDLDINGVFTFLEARHDEIVSGEAMTVMEGLEWLYQDGVGVGVKVKHDVVVAAEGAN